VYEILKQKFITMRKNLAEFIGTFWLVFSGCGSALLAASYPVYGIGFVGVSIAFGLSVLSIAYSFGHVSGAHLNPAVTIGLWAAGKFPSAQIGPYVLSQLSGAIVAAGFLYIILTGNGSDIGGFAANGYGVHSPGKYNLLAAFVTESIMTFMFVLIILGATSESAPKGFAGIAIGLTLTAIHLVSIPVTNTSVNPARSISQALFAGGWAIGQLWLFILAPIIGAFLAGTVYKYFHVTVPLRSTSPSVM
jgi:aquaporin Z